MVHRSTPVLFYFLYYSLALYSQAFETPIQSAQTKQFLAEKQNPQFFSNSRYHTSSINNVTIINAFIKVNDHIDVNQLEELGGIVGTKAGNIWTIKIPASSLSKLTTDIKGIEAIELDQPVFLNMESANAKSKVDAVHSGIDLPQTYTGKGVVVGILDVGFDYTHPSFYSVDGSTYRVKRIWEQKSIGTPPLMYSYGHEITDSSTMLMARTDNPMESHGSHVAGIAAGSGYGGNGTSYRGVAYESDLVLVGITPAQSQWVNTGMTDIIDGINYIYAYAESQGKPAVANLSWGCSIGPHDGTSLFSQAINNLTGPGKIFTISAGNNGDNNIHIQKTFSLSDSLLRSAILFNSGFPENKTWIDIWGEVGELFCIDLSLYNGLFPRASTGFICLTNHTVDTFLIGSDQDTCFIRATAVDADINGKPHVFLDIFHQSNNRLALSIKGYGGTVHAWLGYVFDTRGYYNEFISQGFLSGSVPGDNNLTIGEMACTESALAVGAFASKIRFTNVLGQSLSYDSYVMEDELCPFSSRGPTTDNRTKPDITAPGMTIASALNSYDMRYTPGGDSYNMVVHHYQDMTTQKDFYYGESSGTSMSAPIAAGIMALMLEADPTLTPEAIKLMLQATAIRDAQTTDDPDPNMWGHGKINAHALLLSIINSSTKESEIPSEFIYPNPTAEFLHFTHPEVYAIQVYDLMGKLIYQEQTRNNYISIHSLLPGSYFAVGFDKENRVLFRSLFLKI